MIAEKIELEGAVAFDPDEGCAPETPMSERDRLDRDRLLTLFGTGMKYDKGVERSRDPALAQAYWRLVVAEEWAMTTGARQSALWLVAFAQGSVARVQCELGRLYAREDGVGDYVTAAEWLEKAAGQGYAEAQYNLGMLYANGQGVEQNYVTAAEWFERAAGQGYAAAQYNLGVLYANGQGVELNADKALEAWERAAAQELDVEGMPIIDLDAYCDDGEPQPIAPAPAEPELLCS